MRFVWLALALPLVYGHSGGGCVAWVGTTPPPDGFHCGTCPSEHPDVPVGHEFTLAIGEHVVVGSGGLHVSFERVVEDSRCPAGVMCVRSGEVVVELRAGTDSGGRYQLRPEEAVAVDGYRVRLLRVEPYPSSAAPIEPSDYRATLIVDCL